MKLSIGPVSATLCLIASWCLATAPIAILTSGNVFILLIILASSFLLWGIFAAYSKNEVRYIGALGGQMAWSVCAIALFGGSAVGLWVLVFAHLAIMVTGTRGMWFMIWLPPTEGPVEHGIKKALLQNLLLAYEWLGAAALISGLIIATTPWLVINGGGLALIMLLAMVALISFSLLAVRLRGPE
jgi:hypothetical protein